MYNIMTCEGAGWSKSVLGDCSLVWFTIAITLFLALILRRQCNDGVLSGTAFNFLGALGLGLGSNIVITTIFGSARWSLLAGVLGVAIGGFLLGMIFGGGEESSGDYA